MNTSIDAKLTVKADLPREPFEGPLDLLLRLIEKNEIDIYDLPIAELTDQYMAVLKTFPGDMEGVSDFLLMAATLLEIKSRMLLPKPQASGNDDSGDPREALVQRLLEYKHCQALAEQLKIIPSPGESIVRGSEKTLFKQLSAYTPAQVMDGVPLGRLASVFLDVIKRRELRTDPIRAGYGDMPRERFTVEEKIAFLDSYAKKNSAFSLTRCFEACTSREEMVVTFLALLEMIRRGRLCVRQSDVFGDVWCEKS